MMTLKEFTDKYKNIVHSTATGLYYFVKKHRDELEKSGIIETIQKLEREYIVIKDEKMLLNYIQEKQKQKQKHRVIATKNLDIVVV